MYNFFAAAPPAWNLSQQTPFAKGLRAPSLAQIHGEYISEGYSLEDRE